jgi:hypothetical protein
VTWPHGDPNAVVRGILAGPGYHHIVKTTSEEPHEPLWFVVGQWVWDHLVKPLLHPLGHAIVATRGIGSAAGLILSLCALAALTFVVFRLATAVARAPVAARGGPRQMRMLEAERSARDWHAVARAAAARGDYAAAVAALFSAALAHLDERALVAFDASRTPGEYRRLVRRARAAAAPPFDALTERFDRALYAAEPTRAADYEAAERALAAFEPALGA